VIESLRASSHRLLQRVENLLDLCAVSTRFELEVAPASVPAAILSGLSPLAAEIQQRQKTIVLEPLAASALSGALVDVKRCESSCRIDLTVQAARRH